MNAHVKTAVPETHEAAPAAWPDRLNAAELAADRAVAPKPGSVVARHAAAVCGAAFAKEGSKREAAFNVEAAAALEALIQTRVASVADLSVTAYKLSEAFLGSDPDLTCLNSTNCSEAVQHETLGESERLIASAFRDLVFMTPESGFSTRSEALQPAPSTEPTALQLAFEAIARAQQAFREAEAPMLEASLALHALVPDPDDIAWSFKNGARWKIYESADVRPGGAHWPHFEFRSAATVAATQKAVDDYHRAIAETCEKLGLPLLEALADQAERELLDAVEAAHRTPASSPLEMALKIAFRAADNGHDLTDPDGIQMELETSYGRAQVQCFADALQLAGLPDPTANIRRFDPAEWAVQFEAYPGHELHRGGAAYIEPEAYGAPLDEAFFTSDPVAIENYDRHLREVVFAPYPQTELPKRPSSPMKIVQREAIDWAFPHDEAERRRFHDMWDRRSAALKGVPPGKHLWTELKPWQKHLVLQFAKEREASK